MKKGGEGGYPTPRAELPPSYPPRGASIPCALSRLRVLLVTTGVYSNALRISLPLRRPNCEGLLFFYGFYEQHDEHSAGGRDAQDAENLGEVIGQLRKFHPVEQVHGQQQRAQNDRDHADEDQECPQHGSNRLCRKVAPKLRRTPTEHKQKSASRHSERIGASELSTNNCGLSTVSGGGEGRLGAAEAVDDALAAEDHHGIEERRGHGLAHDGDARGVDEQAGLDAFSFGERAQRVVAGIVVPARRRNRG